MFAIADLLGLPWPPQALRDVGWISGTGLVRLMTQTLQHGRPDRAIVHRLYGHISLQIN